MSAKGTMLRRSLAALFVLWALPPMATAADPPLFASDEVMELALTIDFDDLCRPRESDECDFEATTMEYKDASGDWRSLPIEVQIRGGWRSLARNCSAPLLWVRFDAEQAAGTPFEGQSLLPLTTHCGRGLSLDRSSKRATRADYEQYLLREYLGHLLYRRITEFSVGVRLVRISYPDPDRSGRSALHYAFFAEHFDDLAARTGSRRLPRGNFEPEKLDAQSAATLALFQFMIGNTDWSIARERNTALLIKDGLHIPVPYDLDMSGLVDAPYAEPNPRFRIRRVTQRLYRGRCDYIDNLPTTIRLFQENRQAIYALIDQQEQLEDSTRKKTRKFVDRFFDVIDNPKKVRREIESQCI